MFCLQCCASSLLLICLQRDQLLLSALSADNQVAPILMAAISTLILSTLARCRLWQFDGFFLCLLGIGEIMAVLGSLPVYAVLWTITWSGQIWSEKLVVFTMPVNCLVFLFASSFTAWALAGAGTVCGLGMMIYKLPLVPYQPWKDAFTFCLIIISSKHTLSPFYSMTDALINCHLNIF